MSESDRQDLPPTAWLEPLPLSGGGSLPNHILPAPMDGVTAGSFCSLLARHGLVRCWITPFLRISTGVPRAARLRSRLAPFLESGLPVVVQLMGPHIPTLCGTARRLRELDIAGIDLNCGCPSPTVIGNGAGGACLRSPHWLHDALTALRGACPDRGLSIKLRSGFSRPAEMEAILAAVGAAKPDFAILHFRTVEEGYRSVPRGWLRLARARELAPDLRILGSGDLFSAADALQMYRCSGVDGVAPARGLLRNPHILRELEQACGLRDPDPPARFGPMGFLRDIAVEAGRSPRAGNGFVLNLAAHMLGRNHPRFAALSHCGTLLETCRLLTAFAAEEEMNPGMGIEPPDQDREPAFKPGNTATGNIPPAPPAAGPGSRREDCTRS